MKKLLSILAAFAGLYSFGQVNYVGSGTTAQIDGLNVPSGRSALIYNSTLSQYGFENSAGLWYWLITEADIDTFAELNAIVADQSLLYSGGDAGTPSAIVLTNATGLPQAQVTQHQSALSITKSQVSDFPVVEADLGTSVNASLDLADNSIQNNTSNAVSSDFSIYNGGTGFGISTASGTFVIGAVGPLEMLGGSTRFVSNSDAVFQVDFDQGVTPGANSFIVRNGSGTDVFTVDESGDVIANSFTGSVASATVDASGFSGNLATTDDTVQEIANKFDAFAGGGSGDVVGPASATDNAIARFDTTTGKLLQNSGVTIDDSGNIDATGVVESASIIVGDGTTDRTSDINAALTAYDHAYLIGDVVSTSAITLGDNQRLIGPGTLTNNTTDVLVIDGTNVQVELGAISSNAGNLITFTDNTFTFGLRNTKLSALNSGKSQIYLRGATGVYDMVVEGCYFETGPSHAVPMIDVVVSGENFNGNKFVRNTFQTNGTPGAEVIHLETTAASNWIYDNTISYNLFEIPNDGAVHLYSAAGTKMEGNSVYDLTTATDDLFVVDNTTGGLNSYGTIFRDYHRIGGSLSTFHDFANRGHYANNISIENPMGTAAAQLAFDAVSGHRFVGGAYISDYGGAILNDQVDASGFSGNLTTSDDTLQEIANAVDALSTGGGSGDVTAASNFGTDNVLVRSDGTLKGVQSTTVSVDDNGNLLQNANGSSTAAPRTFGVTNYSTGEAVRWQFGDATNTIENNWGNGTAISSYHTLVLAGGHEGLESGQVNWASNTFATNNNEGLRVALKEDRKAVFWTRNNAARTQPFLEFQDFAGSVVASVDASGNITTTGTVDGFDIATELADGDKGDITKSGASWTIENGAVSTAELAASAVTTTEIANGTIQAEDVEATNAPTDGYIMTYDATSGGYTYEPYTGSGSSAYAYQTLSTDEYSLLDADVAEGGTAAGKKRWNKVATNIDLILDVNDISLTGSPFIIQHNGADSVVVKPETGTTFILAGTGTMTSDAISIKNYESVSFLKDTSTSFYVQGVFTPVSLGACASVYTTSNAINDECGLEANNATVFLVNDADITISSQTSPTPQTGTYFTQLAVNNTSGVTDVNELTLEGVTSGQNVTVSLYVQKISGTNNITLALNTADGWSVGDAVTVTGGTGTWTEYQLTGTANANDPEMRITFLAASATGDTIGIDNLRVTVN